MRLGEIGSGSRLNERSAVSGYGRYVRRRCDAMYIRSTDACSIDKRATERNLTYTYSIKLACE